jgi:hypothetical protein
LVPPGAVLGSFDVVNLFNTTTVPETLELSGDLGIHGRSMEDLEEKAMSTFYVKPHIMLRYVDDLFYEWPEDLCPVKDFFDHLNQQSPHIKFTLETKKQGIIPFLDVKVIKSKEKITAEVNRKKTDYAFY